MNFFKPIWCAIQYIYLYVIHNPGTVGKYTLLTVLVIAGVVALMFVGVGLFVFLTLLVEKYFPKIYAWICKHFILLTIISYVVFIGSLILHDIGKQICHN